jgi:hypothetical protein
MSGRDFVIRYIDNEDETINVSDDEDLLTAYDIAEKDLKGSLKLTVQFKNQLQSAQGLQRSMTSTPIPSTPREESKGEEVPTATNNEAARLLSKQALKKAMKEAQREAAKREKMEAKKALREA